MTVDPFAQAPVDSEATRYADAPNPTDPVVAPEVHAEAPKKAPAKKAAGSIDVAVRPVLEGFTDDSERVRLTLKSGVAYDVPWFTVDFPSIDVAHERLTNAERQGKLADIFGIAAKANAKFVELVSGSKPAAAAAAATASAPATSAPAGATGAPSGETRQCKHGEMQYRSGFSAKTNKTWQAFMCPTPKGTPDQCDAQWIR